MHKVYHKQYRDKCQHKSQNASWQRQYGCKINTDKKLEKTQLIEETLKLMH